MLNVNDEMWDRFVKAGAAVFKSMQEAKTCTCGGKCSCHILFQHGAVPCPLDDPRCVQWFDICHRCVCLNPARQEAACSSK
jgi:hypothetical protein